MMTKDTLWLASQVVYEIFPDRFAIGKQYTPKEKLALACYSRANDYATRDWNELPVSPPLGKDFFGGDICGIIDRLDYLQGLGVTTLFLTPIFFAPSNHKYDATDFFEIDEQFGDERALVELIKQLHSRNMYLFLDIAFNHISDIHPWFVAAMRNEQPFKDFFVRSSDFLEDEFTNANSPDFSLREFNGEFSVEKLCNTLEDNNFGSDLRPRPKQIDWLNIDWLNTLIETPGLYKQIADMKGFDAVDTETKNHINELEGQYKTTNDKNDLKKLNRYLLEAVCPKETPKMGDKFSVRRLCTTIEAGKYGLGLSTAEKTLDWINELIRKPELYDCIIQKKDINILDNSLRTTIDTLKDKCDQSGSEDDLKKLNRYLLEAFYPREVPMGYQSWHGYRPFAELNLTNEKLQGKLFRDDDSVLQKYLEMGVDGFRFDAANDVGMHIIRTIRQTLRQKFPDAIMIGEVTNFAGEWINQSDKYHGVMNYYFHGALYAWLQGNISSIQMNYIVEEYYCGYGKEGAINSWNILSSHDTPRLRNFLADEKQRELAVVAQFTLPGIPFIYYGEEIGMAGGGDPDNRRPMLWDEKQWDKETFDLYRKLIAIRKSRTELQSGDFIMLGHKMSSDALAFFRHTEKPDEVAIIVINKSGLHLREKLFIPYSHLYAQLRLKDLLSDNLTVVQIGSIDLDIPPHSAVILVPDDTEFADYKFYKPRNLLPADL